MAERLRELLQSRDLFVLLVGRELQVRYKQTALGIVWVVLQPLVPAVILSTVFGAFAKLPSDGTPYLVFALSGFVLYGLLAGAVSRAGTSFVRDGQLLSRVYFPRALLPLAAGGAAAVDFLVGLILLLVLAAAVGAPVTSAILFAPVVAALTLALGLACGLAVAALSAHYRDFGHVVPFALQLLLYGSPIAYSLTIIPASLHDVIAINPLVPLVESFRWALLGAPAPSLAHSLIGLASGTVIAAVALAIYLRASRDLADVI